MVYILAVFERELLKLFFHPFMEICHENLSAMSEQKKFFFPWNGIFLKKKHLCISRLQAMKGRSATNSWNIQLCCWQSVTSRNETIAQKVYVSAAYFGVSIQVSTTRAIKTSFVEYSVKVSCWKKRLISRNALSLNTCMFKVWKTV